MTFKDQEEYDAEISKIANEHLPSIWMEGSADDVHKLMGAWLGIPWKDLKESMKAEERRPMRNRYYCPECGYKLNSKGKCTWWKFHGIRWGVRSESKLDTGRPI